MEPKLRNDILSVAFTDITKTFGGKFDTIVGIEARGLIIGLSVANILNVRFVPIRRVGKLPGKCIQIEYTKESGKDVLEVQDHSINKDSKILVVADLLATGCTIKAAEDLISKLGGKVVGMYVVLKSKSSDSEKKLGYPVIFSLSI
jgi:adenine phosphoribosyltransferase